MRTTGTSSMGFSLCGVKPTIIAAAIVIGGSSLCAQQTAAPSASAQPQTKNEMRAAMVWKRFEYVCEGNAKVTVYLRDQTAKVRYGEKQYLMKQTMSADGNRYSDGKVVWWGRGNGGFLQEDKPNGNGEMLVKDCKLVEQSSTQPSAGGVVTGTVTYLQRMALPASAEIVVQLVDVSAADMPATVIAEQKIAAGGKQVPIPFELKFDPVKIGAKHTYSVSAKITVDGQLRFISDKPYPVVTRGNGMKTEVVVRPVAK